MACGANCPCQCVKPRKRRARKQGPPRRNPVADLVTALLTQKLQEGINKPPIYKPEPPEKKSVSTSTESVKAEPIETQTETKTTSEIETQTGGAGSRGPYKPRVSQVEQLADRLQILEKGRPRSRSLESVGGDPGSMSGLATPANEPMKQLKRNVVRLIRPIPEVEPKPLTGGGGAESVKQKPYETYKKTSTEETRNLPIVASLEEAKARSAELKAQGFKTVRIVRPKPAGPMGNLLGTLQEATDKEAGSTTGEKVDFS